MAYVPLYELLPEIADNETRVITVLENDLGIPPSEYGIVELYCNDKNCDCRRVLLNVTTSHNMETVAVISFGWESIEYYKKWMKMGGDRKLSSEELFMLEELKGPSLDFSSPPNEYSIYMLEMIKDYILTDEEYVNRIKEHYKLFRRKVEEIHTGRAISKKIGRNDPCPCGSGKKHKKCCLGKDIIFTEEAVKHPSSTNASDVLDDDVDEELEDIDFGDDFLLEMMDAFQQLSLDIRMRALKKKSHIIEYQKARKLHSEIVNSMMDDYYNGKFEQRIETNTGLSKNDLQDSAPDNYLFYESNFDLNNPVSLMAFQDMVTYKPAENMNSLTEEYIAKKRYRREDKKEFLQSMLESRLGLFQIVDTDEREGYVWLEDIFTGEKVQIIDIALSGVQDIEPQYIYTRIITYNGFSFGSGLNFVFKKTNPFIKKFIRQEKKNFSRKGEFPRFLQLYNQYIKNEDSVHTRTNVVK